MLKLPKLPDRTPVRIILTVSPALHGDLAAYAGAYRQAYGSAESVAELIPFMLEAFLASDRDFARLRREGIAVPLPEPRRGRRPKASTISVNPTTSPEQQS